MKHYKVEFTDGTTGFMSPTDIAIKTGLHPIDVDKLWANAEYINVGVPPPIPPVRYVERQVQVTRMVRKWEEIFVQETILVPMTRTVGKWAWVEHPEVVWETRLECVQY